MLIILKSIRVETGLEYGSLKKKKKSLSIMKAACNRYFSSRVHLDRTKSIGIDEIHAIELRRYCSL